MKRDYLVIFIAGREFKFVDVRELEINDHD